MLAFKLASLQGRTSKGGKDIKIMIGIIAVIMLVRPVWDFVHGVDVLQTSGKIHDAAARLDAGSKDVIVLLDTIADCKQEAQRFTTVDRYAVQIGADDTHFADVDSQSPMASIAVLCSRDHLVMRVAKQTTVVP